MKQKIKCIIKNTCDFTERLNTLHLLSITAILCSLLFLVSFWLPIIRTIEAVRDFGTSLNFYFQKIFLHRKTTVTITELSSLDFFVLFPISWEEFKEAMKDFFPTFFTLKHFLSYLAILASSLYRFSFFLLLFLPVFIGLFILFRMTFTTEVEEEKISLPLRLYLRFSTWAKDKVAEILSILKII